MRVGKCGPQTAFVGRNQDQMDMVRHQAVAPHLDASDPATLRDQSTIFGIVILAEENRLPPVAALRNVMRNPRYDDPC